MAVGCILVQGQFQKFYFPKGEKSTEDIIGVQAHPEVQAFTDTVNYIRQISLVQRRNSLKQTLRSSLAVASKCFA